MSKIPDLRLLVHFDALVECCSVSRAAERLNISQPAMSSALSRLRKLFNDPLIVREDGVWVATVKARELQSSFHPLIDKWHSAMQPLEQFDPRRTKRVFSMHSTDYVQFAVLSKIAKHLAEDAPSLHIRTIPARLNHGLSMLESNYVELMAGYYPDPTPTLHSRVLFEEKFVCIVRSGHRCLRRPWTLDAWLGNGQIDLAAHTGYSSGHIDRALRSIDKKRRISLTLTSYLAAPFIVAQSDLVAVLPENVAQAVMRHGGVKILDVPIKLPTSRISLYWHERYQNDLGHRWLRQYIGSLVSSAN